jgi:hypothetical protein
MALSVDCVCKLCTADAWPSIHGLVHFSADFARKLYVCLLALLELSEYACFNSFIETMEHGLDDLNSFLYFVAGVPSDLILHTPPKGKSLQQPKPPQNSARAQELTPETASKANPGRVVFS